MFDTFIFVPAYNVSSTLKAVLQKIPPEVWNRSKVCVINDGSKDETCRTYNEFVQSELGEERGRRISLVDFKQNQGYGAVVKRGIQEGLASGAKFVACLHGDGQYPAHMLGQFLDHLDNFRTADGQGREFAPLALLQGSRHAVAGSAKKGNMPLHKRVGGAFLTALENLAFKQKLTDRHSGFILYRTDFLKTVDVEKLSPSFDIDLELISIADARGFAVGELPIPTVYADEKSSLNVVNYGLRCLRLVWRRLWMK